MAKSRTQWHPLLGRLLRHRVEGYYDMQTNVPVGDLPRQTDFVLLRRLGTLVLPFRGLWRNLTTWNALEYKGPTVNARRKHLPLLAELGLGIYRRLSALSRKKRQPVPPVLEVSFWYLANQLTRGFLGFATGYLSGLEQIEEGVWKSTVLGHPCLLVSVVDLPLDEDSLPLRVLARQPVKQEVAVGEFVIAASERFAAYGSTFAALHPAAWKEVETMARAKRQTLNVDLRPVVDLVGLDSLIKQIGEKEIIQQIGKKEIIQQIGEKEIIQQIGEKEVIQQIGEKQVIQQIGEKQVIQRMGKKHVLEQMNVDDILENLPPAKRRALQRRLNAESRG